MAAYHLLYIVLCEGPATKKNRVRDLKSFEIFRDIQIYKGFNARSFMIF